MKKIFYIKTISKFDSEIYLYPCDKDFIDLGKIFWNKIFSKKYIESLFKNINFNDKKYSFSSDKYFKNDFNFVLKNISRAAEILKKDFWKNYNYFNVIFAYRIFNTLLSYLNIIFDEYIFGFSIGLNHKYLTNIDDFKNFFNLKIRNDFLENFIITELDKKNISNSLVIIKIYGPEELLQALIIASYLKEKGNKVVLDCSVSNEQFNFSTWIESIKLHSKFIFSFFDYIILYQDYQKSLNKIISDYKNGLNTNESSDIINNVCYINNGNFIFNKPKNIDSLELFDDFNKYFFKKKNISTYTGFNFFKTRLLPYRCYWSACKFCAINSTNLYAYKNDFDLIKKQVDFFIDFIKKNKINYVVFLDEAIHPDVLSYLIEQIKLNNLKITYRFRTRFDEKYTLDFCREIYDSGARFCGIGLESFSEETNMKINKTTKNFPNSKKIEIIKNFENVGLNLHLYSIMGFPGEKKSDILKTYSFLKNNIINLKFFTCSPNVFYLMKGTEYYNNMNDYNISLKEENDFDLAFLDFKNSNKDRDIDFLFKLHFDLEKEQFIPWLKKRDLNIGNFWNFIDKSGFFYFFKTQFNISPFREKINISIDNKLDLNGFYKISDYTEVVYEEGNNIEIYDWVKFKTLIVNKKFKKFINHYNKNCNLQTNIKNLIKNFSKKDILVIQDFLNNGFLNV